jgi:hypothetical protein
MSLKALKGQNMKGTKKNGLLILTVFALAFVQNAGAAPAGPMSSNGTVLGDVVGYALPDGGTCKAGPKTSTRRSQRLEHRLAGEPFLAAVGRWEGSIGRTSHAEGVSIMSSTVGGMWATGTDGPVEEAVLLFGDTKNQTGESALWPSAGDSKVISERPSLTPLEAVPGAGVGNLCIAWVDLSRGV